MSKVVIILVLIWIVWVIGFPFGHAFAVTFWWDTRVYADFIFWTNTIDYWRIESELGIDEARKLNAKADSQAWELVKVYVEAS